MVTKEQKGTAFLLFILIFSLAAKANNIQVSNTKLIRQNSSVGYTMIQFDLMWENSWRTNNLNGDGVTNWDAAWVFVKYRIPVANGGDGLWKHAWLNDADHSTGTGTGATIDAGLRTPGSAFHATTNPALGVFVYRSGPGSGTFATSGMQLRWNYGANGVADNASVDIQVFAIEMVYVPQGAYYLGSGGSEDAAFYRYPTSTNAFQVQSENAITVGTATDNLYYPTVFWGGDRSGPIPAEYPKGYDAFYCMKYEISQQQYVSFLNTLTTTQATNRYSSSSTGSRYGITVTGGVFSTTYPYVACNWLNWTDGAAYSDWAGLRPMTELEFEKVCRGTVAPVANEYAWGTVDVAGNSYTISNSGQNDETIDNNYSTTVGNASWNNTDGSIDGPLRVGIFAANANNTGRITSGASYYGIMELSGNLWERPVCVGNTTGRAYTGVHGDGSLSNNGHANETSWPGLNNGEVTSAAGSGFRGGEFTSNAMRLCVSNRTEADYNSNIRAGHYGARAVRIAP